MKNLAEDILYRRKFAKDKANKERRAVLQMPKRSRVAQLLVDHDFRIVVYKGKEVLAERTYKTAFKLGWPEGLVLKDPIVVRKATEEDIRKHHYFGAIYV